MATAATLTAPCFFHTPRKINPTQISIKKTTFSFSKSKFSSFKTIYAPIHHFNSNNISLFKKPNNLICNSLSTVSSDTTKYEFSDGTSEVELRLELEGESNVSSKDVFVDADETSLLVRVNYSGSLKTAVHIDRLYDRINPAQTIWLLDEDQLVIILKKQDAELKWPDIKESWASLNEGVLQLLKGASIYVVGDSSEINQKVSRELAVGLGYTQLDTQELLETLTKQTIDSLVDTEGSDAVAETESAILESLSSHIRSVVSTLGGPHGAAIRAGKWRHLYSGFTVWLSQSEATGILDKKIVFYSFSDEKSAQEEAKQNILTRSQAYSNADVVVKLGGWDPDYSKDVAQASLSALKRLVLEDKKLPGKKGLYIRLGCRGDWPDIKPPGWDPSSGVQPPSTY